jgi:hypothetical protein
MRVPRDLLHMFSKFIQQTEYPEPRGDHPASTAIQRRREQQDSRE